VFERFTDSARAVVVLAQDEARAFNHNYIGTEHLLLGLLRQEDGVAAAALRNLRVDAGDVRDQVVSIIGRGDQAPSTRIPFTPRSKKVLELSLREALALDCDYIGTEHLLLGMVREGDGVAAQVLSNLGAGLSATRDEVKRLLSGGALDPGGTPAAPIPPDAVASSTDVAGLQAEILRLRLLLQRHGIDPDSDAA
jgi:ATP-dependent Clp protease ATP-binding subunit ClpC